jgi:hypothetical protein
MASKQDKPAAAQPMQVIFVMICTIIQVNVYSFTIFSFEMNNVLIIINEIHIKIPK